MHPAGRPTLPLMDTRDDHSDQAPSAARDRDLDEIQQLVAEGRRLAIYDRATNLYAYWYLRLRASEEIARARRYQKPLSLLSIWASTQQEIDAASAYMREHLRYCDLAAYLNNGHFVVVLCETEAAGAEVVVERLRDAVGTSEIALLEYADNGETFDELLERIKAEAGPGRRVA